MFRYCPDYTTITTTPPPPPPPTTTTTTIHWLQMVWFSFNVNSYKFKFESGGQNSSVLDSSVYLSQTDNLSLEFILLVRRIIRQDR